jgi:hypothetical protein
MAERVVFLRPDAERIARVVRRVEGFRADPPLTFRRVLEQPSRKVFRVCTFDGAWATGTPKTVTFKNQTSTPNTVSALNLFFPITENAVSADCAVAKEGTAWYLIDVPFQTATVSVAQVTASGFFAQATATGVVVQSTGLITFASAGSSQAVVSDISISATLNTNDCSITVSKTVSTASVTIAGSTATAMVVGSTATTVSITSTATAVFVTQTATATVLRFKVN